MWAGVNPGKVSMDRRRAGSPRGPALLGGGPCPSACCFLPREGRHPPDPRGHAGGRPGEGGRGKDTQVGEARSLPPGTSGAPLASAPWGTTELSRDGVTWGRPASRWAVEAPALVSASLSGWGCWLGREWVPHMCWCKRKPGQGAAWASEGPLGWQAAAGMIVCHPK